MRYKSDYKRIKEHTEYLREEFGFDGVLHFTDFKNLENIIKDGFLYSRGYCQNNNINFVDGSNQSVLDKARDYVKCSVRFYYRGKSPTLFNNEGVKKKEYCNSIHIPIPVYLLFDEKLIYLDFTKFSDGNATNSDIDNTAEFFENMDWEAIFHTGRITGGRNSYIKNKRHAELLSNKPVSLKFLKKIIFRCDADKKRAINILGDDSRYTVNLKLFSDKNKQGDFRDEYYNNFIKDYNIIYLHTKDEEISEVRINIKLNKCLNDYEIDTRVFRKDGSEPFYYFSNSFDDDFVEENNNYNEKYKYGHITLQGDTDEWYKIVVYMNNYVSIEEFLIKDILIKHNLKIESGDNYKKIILKREFRSLDFKRYEHKYEFLNGDGKIVYKCKVESKKDSETLSKSITFSDISNELIKIRYYIDDVICHSEEI